MSLITHLGKTMLVKQRIKATVFNRKSDEVKADPVERPCFLVASKLCVWQEHEEGSGSRCIAIRDSLKLRFADHEHISSKFPERDFSFVNRIPTSEDLEDIADLIDYPEYVKKLRLRCTLD
jgi:hypothetical protein